jgi:outer membrane protein
MRVRVGARLRWAALALALSVPAPAWAETASGKLPTATVMVLDVQAALQQSVAAKAARVQRDQYLQNFQAESEANRKSLKDAEAELVKLKPTMPADAWQQKARTFEQQVFEFNQRFQRNNQAVEKSFRAAMGELSDALAQVAEEVASEQGANLVLPKSQIFLHDPRMEMTRTVIDRLNKKHPSVNFPAPAVEGSPAAAKPAPQPKKK